MNIRFERVAILVAALLFSAGTRALAADGRFDRGGSQREVRKTATLVIETEPAGLKVTVNGESAGRSPFTRAKLDPGEYLIAIDDPGWQPSSERVSLGMSEDRRMVLVARPNPAKAAPTSGSASADSADAGASRTALVRVAGGGPELLRQAVAAVKQLNINIREGATCAAAGRSEDAAELVLIPTESSRQGALGMICSVDLRVHSTRCSGVNEGEGLAQGKGLNPSDRTRACASAWRQVSDERVAAAVAEALRGLWR